MFDKKSIWEFCPLCSCELELQSAMGGFGRAICISCNYVYQQTGSYSAVASIGKEKFNLDDMFDDSEAMDKRIEELKEEKYAN